ncbi:hypothetical protein O6P43_013477 [Quillaja saponaria]|uniref:Uncharacterized protein n=1 Tax=Quillaja saponaria TaxID=32244 RepID=A0AAD7LSW9_QUISA|nr:hypothetical protein O6P43_013477 [Quillaja saponaria]
MKNHLLMEFMNARCSGLMDTLLAETIRDMNIFELLNSLPPASLEPNYNFDPNRDRTSGYILDGLYFLFLARFRGMEECSSDVELPLVSGWMGNFSEEVVEVVRSAADVINRTDVDAVKQLVIIALLTCSSECAKLPPYDIYFSAWKLANKLGAAKVSIEQLAVAAVRKGAGLEYCKIQPESSNFFDEIERFQELSICASICEGCEEYAKRACNSFNVRTSSDDRLYVFNDHPKEFKCLWSIEEPPCGTQITV